MQSRQFDRGEPPGRLLLVIGIELIGVELESGKNSGLTQRRKEKKSNSGSMGSRG
jgi:hypothetical protein